MDTDLSLKEESLESYGISVVFGLFSNIYAYKYKSRAGMEKFCPRAIWSFHGYSTCQRISSTVISNERLAARGYLKPRRLSNGIYSIWQSGKLLHGAVLICTPRNFVLEFIPK